MTKFPLVLHMAHGDAVKGNAPEYSLCTRYVTAAYLCGNLAARLLLPDSPSWQRISWRVNEHRQTAKGGLNLPRRTLRATQVTCTTGGTARATATQPRCTRPPTAATSRS